LCVLFLALVASSYARDHAATYYTEPFSAANPFTKTIESQWEGMNPPGLAIYGWNVTAIGATLINVSRADIVTSTGRHYNKTHSITYHPPGNSPSTIHGFHLEVADPCLLSLARDETFRIHYRAETNGHDGTWGQYLRTETVPTLTLPEDGAASLLMHVCRKVYTPDLVCEMISSRFVHLTIPHFQPGQVEEFDIIIDSPLTAINETLSSIVVSSGSDCPTTLNAFTRHPIDLKHVGTVYFEFTVMAHAPTVWIMLNPTNKVHSAVLEFEPYAVVVRSKRVTPSGDPYNPVSQPLSGGAIFGIIVGVVAGVGIIAFALYYFRARWLPGQNNYANL
jgi:hypothetical protein